MPKFDDSRFTHSEVRVSANHEQEKLAKVPDHLIKYIMKF